MTDLSTLSIDELRALLLTCDGRGKEAKTEALERLLEDAAKRSRASSVLRP